MGGKKKRREIRSGRGSLDAAAWAMLYRQHYPAIRSRFAAGVACEQDVDDLAQQVFAELARGRMPDNPQVYIDGIASRVLSRYRRRKATERAVLRELQIEAIPAQDERQPPVGQPPSADEALGRQGASDETRAEWDGFPAEILAGLEPEQAELLRLRFVEGLRVADVARRLGCSKAAAYKRLQRTIRRLRERYGVERNPTKNPRELKIFIVNITRFYERCYANERSLPPPPSTDDFPVQFGPLRGTII